ncbi:type I restriction endonuclease subunit R, EcoR124 family [Globicatella sulfidifaciens]|uniref:type I restriction endonuclease subunit R, EcoR124 family n=1 Tax=Globicatella sulfidifaciens TaxID=136093 RepID=UPI00289356B5|nr:hypothetical protein [Globicatella sulfidifaciens]
MAIKEQLLSYHDETHIPRVVEEILSNWESQSQEKFFDAILTVAYKDRVIAYYNEFKRALVKMDYDLNVAMTFSFGNENDPDGISPDVISEMFKDYGKFTGIEFRVEDGDSYFKDLVVRSTRGGSGRNPRNIDLIIVADQLLTGYDSRYVNTLYVDRSLELQGLIQAYSRTNRVQGPMKEFGTIINYKYPAMTEEQVNRALTLYGSGGTSSLAIVEHYEVAVHKFKEAVEWMEEVLPDPTNWADLETNNEQLDNFIESFTHANQQLNTVQQYYQYEWNDTEFGINEHQWMKYIGAYKNLEIEEDDDVILPIQPLVGRAKLSGTQVIDADHILGLIEDRVSHQDGIQTVDTETLRIIHQQIQELSDMGEDDQAKLLKEFVDTELVTGNLSSNSRFDDLFEDWKDNKAQREIDKFAKDWGLDANLLSESVKEYSLNKKEIIPYIEDLQRSVNYEEARKPAVSPLIHTMQLVQTLPEYMVEIKKKYE